MPRVSDSLCVDLASWLLRAIEEKGQTPGRTRNASTSTWGARIGRHGRMGHNFAVVCKQCAITHIR
jgi:hypothetical protein